jgi:beta,beta-carotene 9',10'-dioxygenase
VGLSSTWSRSTGHLVRTARTDALFAFHHVNAFEIADGLAVDVIVYPDATIIDQLYLARLRAGAPVDATGILTRFRVPLSGDEPVTHRTLAPATLELPRINYAACAGRPYRYVWGTGVQVQGDFLDSVAKIDTETGSVTHWYENGLYPGEPVFVPAPSGQVEDDGVLLSVVLDIDKDRSFLLVLDAATLEEKARAEVPHAIPFHFHGNYFANGSGASQ